MCTFAVQCSDNRGLQTRHGPKNGFSLFALYAAQLTGASRAESAEALNMK